MNDIQPIGELAISTLAGAPATGGGFTLPATIADHGDKAAERFFTFFTDTIPNKNTRAAYYRNALLFFAWAEKSGLTLTTIKGQVPPDPDRLKDDTVASAT